MDPRDAWTLRRILSGRDVNGQLTELEARFRPIGEHMAKLPPEARAEVWTAHVGGLYDGADIIRALAEADPEAPSPFLSSDISGIAGDWEPIRVATLPPAEPFPLDILPEPARALAEAAARSIASPVDFAAVGTIATASGLIGRSATLRVKSRYYQSTALYLAAVGDASSGKSPSLGAAMAPIWDVAELLRVRHREEMRDWKEASADDRGDPPALGRIITTDATTEAIGPILAANTRGLFLAPDEMTKWVFSMDQYKGGRGGDRPFYLSAWNGDPIFIDRAKRPNDPIIVPQPFITLAGGMTPDMLSALPEGKGRDDGFLARLLFSYPESMPRSYCEEGIPAGIAEGWSALGFRLWRRPLRVTDGKTMAHIVEFEPEAARAWVDWCRMHYAEVNADDFSEALAGAWGKLEAYAARLALILHLLHVATDPDLSDIEIPPLPEWIIASMARLIVYFKSHARRVYATLERRADAGNDDVRALLRWIVRNEQAAFSERDIRRNFDRFEHDPEALPSALLWMVGRNLIRVSPQPEANPKGGRKPSPRYEVNPEVMTSPRFRRFRRNAV